MSQTTFTTFLLDTDTKMFQLVCRLNGLHREWMTPFSVAADTNDDQKITQIHRANLQSVFRFSPSAPFLKCGHVGVLAVRDEQYAIAPHFLQNMDESSVAMTPLVGWSFPELKRLNLDYRIQTAIKTERLFLRRLTDLYDDLVDDCLKTIERAVDASSR